MESSKNAGKTVFITVGTTLFDELIQTLDQQEIVKQLVDAGYTNIKVQTGKGKHDPTVIKNYKGVKAEVYDYKPSLMEDIRSADLIISHAGAGTTLEGLREKKKLIVVNNERLMGNHQMELITALTERKHILGFEKLSDIKTNLKSYLEAVKKGDLKEYPPADTSNINKVMEEMLSV